ncbi:hypothetical protein BKA64DRAFT_705358 [Cadophora sp. MPI-SDFR-AT-0126]|nr:hypothetical protein BKA64DRAFT_705358 [Leotiomycetes sp. MPI-SDFR-AT-0126]
MKFTNLTLILLASFVASPVASVPVTEAGLDLDLETRQVPGGVMENADLLRVQRILDQARSSGVGRVRARRLTEAQERRCTKQPATECNACMDRAVSTTILEVMGCGVAVLAAGALSGGTAAILGATGFLICDGIAYNAYENQLMTCRGV